jgi:hypothetical protein
VQAGAASDAIDEMRQAVALSGGSTETLLGLAQAHAADGMSEEMARILQDVTGQAKRYASPYNVARVHSAHRDPEHTFAWLERAYDERNPDLIELRTDPVFDSVRRDSRFADLQRRVGWRE